MGPARRRSLSGFEADSGRTRRAVPRTAPDATTSRLLAASTITPAGRFFTAPPVSPDKLPASPDSVFVVHVALERGGFRVNSRPVPPRMLGKVIKYCPEWRGRPVVIVMVGSATLPGANGTLLSALAATLDVPVLSSETRVFLGARLLITGGSFLRHDPPGRRSGKASAVVRVGPVLPPVAYPRRFAPVAIKSHQLQSSTSNPTKNAVQRHISEDSTPVEMALVKPIPPVSASLSPTELLLAVTGSGAWPRVPVPPDPVTAAQSPAAAGVAPVETARPMRGPRPVEDTRPIDDVGVPVDGMIRPLRPGITGSSTMTAPSVTVPTTDPAVPTVAAAGPTADLAGPTTAAVRAAEVADQAIADPAIDIDVVAVPQHLLVPTAEIRLPEISIAHPLPELREAAAADGAADASQTDQTGRADSAQGDSTQADSVHPDSVASAGVGESTPAEPSVAEQKTAPWIQVVPSATREDRERLRSLLGWRYEAHARAVAGMLALQPGLRATGGGDDLLAGLVAVRAHLSNTAEQVDAVLRGDEPQAQAAVPDSGESIDAPGAELLARCAASGLSRLPVVVGAVFRPGSPDTAVLARYRTGLTIVEPAFTEATLGRFVSPDSTVEYAIWSSSGRRTDRLDGIDAGAQSAPTRVLFSAGMHFRVLGVEKPSDTGRVRVLLREVPQQAGRDDRADERAKQRLLESVERLTASEVAGLPAARWRHPLGIREDAVIFAFGHHR